jgi:UDP-3-O-[3-hydroxymyristoyl] glucosamine N-acyltransferase
VTWTVAALARALGAAVEGDGSIEVDGATEPAEAGPRDLALALSPRWAEALARGAARAALVWPGADWRALGLEAAIVAPRGRLALARLTQALDAADEAAGVHPFGGRGAGRDAGRGGLGGAAGRRRRGRDLGRGHADRLRDVRRGRRDPRCELPDRARRADHAARDAGKPRDRSARRRDRRRRLLLRDRDALGAEVARASLGREAPLVPEDPTWHRIHSLGGVVIGDDVEVGANSTIDAGTIRPTRVGRGTKIDNLVQVAHNVVVGEDCLLCGQAGVAGSTILGDRVVLGGQAGVVDNLRVGSDVVAAAGALILSNVPAGRVVMGSPATRMDAQIESYKALRRLPRLLRDLAARAPRGGQDD